MTFNFDIYSFVIGLVTLPILYVLSVIIRLIGEAITGVYRAYKYVRSIVWEGRLQPEGRIVTFKGNYPRWWIFLTAVKHWWTNI